MNRHHRLHQARRQRAEQITARLLAACARQPETPPTGRAETIEDFIARGGRIRRIPAGKEKRHESS